MESIPWELAWHSALYSLPGGFYRTNPPSGHFATSAQGITGTTAVLADVLAHIARAASLRHVIDLAAGRGELATALARRHPHLEVTAVDIVPRPEHLDHAVRWHITQGADDITDLPDASGALIFAHEWLDVIPTPIWQIDEKGSPRTVLVDPRDGTESLGGAPGDPDGPRPEDLAWCRQWWPLHEATPGSRIEVGRRRDLAWSQLVDHAGDGLAIAVDYGHTRDNRPATGSLCAYRHGRQVRPVPDRSCDLTTHVAVDSLPGSHRIDQRTLLQRCGLRADTPDPRSALTDPAGYIAALQHAGAAARLLDRHGLGSFYWVLSDSLPDCLC